MFENQGDFSAIDEYQTIGQMKAEIHELQHQIIEYRKALYALLMAHGRGHVAWWQAATTAEQMLYHVGDPCVYCKNDHDNVKPGLCDGIKKDSDD